MRESRSEESSSADAAVGDVEKNTTSVPPEGNDDEKTNSSVPSTPDEDGSENRLEKTPSQAQRMSRSKIAIIMTALCLSVFLAALDMTIVSTALPVMAADFHTSQSGYSWMASSYLLANAACIPLWGKISDIWGRKPIILIGNVIFLVGSLVCALAKDLTMMLAGRAVQGVGGGGLIILSNIVVTDLFSVRERPIYYGLFGGTWAAASALGPIIGGAFTTRVTWRWCFYLNLPVGGVSFVIVALFLSVETPKTPLLDGLRAIDWLGTFTIVGATLMFLFGLEFGGVDYPWDSATVICLLVFGVVTYGIVFIVEWKFAKYPVIPVRLFNNRQNILIFLICSMHGFVFISAAYYIPLYFQTVLLATPILSGVYTLPQVLVLSVMSALVGIVIRRTGRYKEIIIAGMIFMTLGFGLFIDLKPYASWPRIIIYQMIAGAGIGPLFQSPLVALQANIHPSDMATATATFGFIRQLSTSISVVIGGVIYENVFRDEIPGLREFLGPRVGSQLEGSFSGSLKPVVESLPTEQKNAILSAFTYALSRTWIFYCAVAGVGLITSLFIKKKELSKSHAIAKTGLEEQERARRELLELEKARRKEKKEQV